MSPGIRSSITFHWEPFLNPPGARPNHLSAATIFWNLEFLRNGSKLGSILSQSVETYGTLKSGSSWSSSFSGSPATT